MMMLMMMTVIQMIAMATMMVIQRKTLSFQQATVTVTHIHVYDETRTINQGR